MKLSLFSVSYAGLWGQAALDLPEFIERAGRLGYQSVMLMGKRPHLSPLDATPERIAAVRRALDRAAVDCDVVAAYTDLRPAPAGEVPAVEMQIAYVEALARVAVELGANVVRVFTAYEADHAPLQATWRCVVDALAEICRRVEPLGVSIAVQNHHDTALHTSALLELLDDVGRPNCRLGFDAWSPALRGEDLYTAAREAAARAVLTTNADYILVPRYRYRAELVNYEQQPTGWVRAVPFGSGMIDYPAFFRGLADGGFDGVAAYEMCSPVRGGGQLENLDGCAAAYVRWMRAHRGTSGAAADQPARGGRRRTAPA